MTPIAKTGISNLSRRQSHVRQRGILLVWMALLGIVMFAILMLAVDMGYVYLTVHQLQNASDSGALAGAAKVKFNQSQAKTAAINATAANYAAGQSVGLNISTDVLVGNYNRNSAVFTNNGTPYNAVRVIARRTDGAPGGPVNLFFGPMFGFDTSNVTRTATAMSGGTFNAGLIVLDPNKSGAFSLNGNVDVRVNNGGIQVNSSNSTAATSISGTAANVSATVLRINGGLSTSGHPSLPSKTYTNTSPVNDPLAGLPAPALSPNRGTLSVPNNTSATADPGYYPGGIIVGKGATLTLNPGVYSIGGPTGLSLGNKSTFIANGVMLYFTKSTTNVYAPALGLNGGDNITVTPPTTGVYAGISVFVDRTRPYASWSLGGNSELNLSGTVYMPSMGLSLQGNPGFAANQIIASTVSVGGNPQLYINYDGRNPVEINNVFLVE